MPLLLSGKTALITGVANNRSIAWGIARALHREGARLAFTYQIDRFRENLLELLQEFPDHADMPTAQLDVQSDDDIAATFRMVEERFGKLDILVHCLAYADREAISGPVKDITRAGYAKALDISAYSLIPLARAALPLMRAAGGGSIFTLTYLAAERVVPGYNVMAFAKAALECEVRYLAWELGEDNIRVNAISAGPLKTMAATAVKGLTAFRGLMETHAPLRRNVTAEEVGDVGLFLASDLSRAITGETIYVDCGYHAMGALKEG